MKFLIGVIIDKFTNDHGRTERVGSGEWVVTSDAVYLKLKSDAHSAKDSMMIYLSWKELEEVMNARDAGLLK